DDAGGHVRQAHRRVGGVHRLAAGAGGTVDVDADVVVRDVDVVGGLHDRQDLHLGEGRLAAALVVERRDAHQAVRALFHRQGAVHVFAVDDERRRLDAGFLRVGDVVHVDLVAGLFRPAGVHAHEHFGEVGGVDAAGAGADVDDRLTLVVFAGQHGRDLEGLDGGAEVGAFLVGKLGGFGGGVAVLFLGELVHDGQVVEAFAQA